MPGRSPPRHVVIIGNGVAGVTTAMTLRKRDRGCRITLISGESDDFYSRPALMYLYMGHMRFEHVRPYEAWHWKRQRIERVRAWVDHVDVQAKQLRFTDRPPMNYDQLVIATGSVPNRFGWPGQDLAGVQGLCTLQDLESLERLSPTIERGVIVGGGLIGVELAEMLHSRGKKVTILAREQSYWDNALPREEADLVGRVIRAAGVELRCSTQLKEIIDDGQGRARAVVTGEGERIDCQFVGLTAGVSPNLGALKGSDVPTGRGVLVDFSFRTTVPDVFACGDCAELVVTDGGRNRIEPLWYTAQMHGEVLGRVLAGEDATYDRGVWFNSAKFFDLEWQTYGHVPPAGTAGPDVRELYWETEGAAAGPHAFRLVLRDGRVVGVNSMGIRYRHAVCERWILDALTAEQVLERLPEGNFDPEFSRHHEADIVRTMREQLR